MIRIRPASFAICFSLALCVVILGLWLAYRAAGIFDPVQQGARIYQGEYHEIKGNGAVMRRKKARDRDQDQDQ